MIMPQRGARLAKQLAGPQPASSCRGLEPKTCLDGRIALEPCRRDCMESCAETRRALRELLVSIGLLDRSVDAPPR